MILYCYHIAPIDFFPGCMTTSQVMETILDDPLEAARQMLEIAGEAESAFRAIEWEGDYRDGPQWFCVPDENSTLLGYIAKQDNNGSTFVASQIPLPHLQPSAQFSAIVKDGVVLKVTP